MKQFYFYTMNPFYIYSTGKTKFKNKNEMSKWIESPNYSYFLKYILKPLLLKSLNIEKMFWSAQVWVDEHWLYV